MDTGNGEQNESLEGLDPDFQVSLLLQEVLVKMQGVREPLRTIPESPGRHCSIAITELEKVIAYWDYYVVRSDYWSAAAAAKLIK